MNFQLFQLVVPSPSEMLLLLASSITLGPKFITIITTLVCTIVGACLVKGSL